MIRRRAYKFRIYPNKEQAELMAKFAGCSRFVYNKCLALQKARYEARKIRIEAGDKSVLPEDKHLSQFDLTERVTQWRADADTRFLSECPYDVLTAATIAITEAYKRFFKTKTGYPRFHHKQANASYRQQAKVVRFENNHINIPKVGAVKCRGWDEIQGKVKNIGVSRIAGQWFCSLQTEFEVEEPVHPTEKIVGIDRGVVHTVVLSDGSLPMSKDDLETYEERRRDVEQRIRVLQRRHRNKVAPDHRKKQIASNRWKKAQQQIAKLQVRLANMRENHLHVTTHNITSEYKVIAIEDLNVQKMTKSAKGTAEAPGKNVRAKSGLNREILARAWGELRRQLMYKSGWKGGMVVEVLARNTSRKCSECGHIDKDNRKSQAEFECQACGHSMNADLNAAINIRELAVAA